MKKHLTWAEIAHRAESPVPEEGPIRTIFWHFYGQTGGFPRIHSCPAFLATGVIDYVRQRHGLEPVEVLCNESLTMDPGGTLWGADHPHRTASFGEGEQSYPLSIHPYHAETLLSWIPQCLGEPEYRRIFEGVPCLRVPSFPAQITVFPLSDCEAILAFLDTLLPEHDAICKEAKHPTQRLGGPKMEPRIQMRNRRP